MRVERAHDDLGDAAMVLRQTVTLRMFHERGRLATTARDVSRGAVRLLEQRHRDLGHTARELHSSALRRLDQDHARLSAFTERTRRCAERRLERDAARLDQQATRQRLLDPRRVLARGYALVRDEQGRVLPDAASIVPDQNLAVQLRDGTVRTRATSIHPAS